MSERVVVRVPATIANLGPGFDCLGLAVDWHDEIVVERAGSLQVTVNGPGAGSIPTGPENLVVRALAAVLGETPSVHVHEDVEIPFGRGFGSSAAAIVAGLVAARAIEDTEHTDRDLLHLAVELEGHADNVAPCLLGGVTVTAGEHTLHIDPPDGLRVLVCVAPQPLSTERARGVLPDAVPRADAVANVGRAAMLAAALASGRIDDLLATTEDVLHQPYRFPLVPESAEVVRALRARGVAAFLSGAGPSVAALVPVSSASDAEAFASSHVPSGWDVRVLEIDPDGARAIAHA